MFYSAQTAGFYDPAIHGDNIPTDAVQITAEQHAELIAGQSAGQIIAPDADGRPVLVDPPAPTPEQVLATYTAAIEAHVEDVARSRQYTSAVSAASYVVSTNAAWAAEAQAFVAWRDSVWSFALAELARVEAGEIEPPALPDLIASLPAIAWPA
jgi:hypothetical protein